MCVFETLFYVRVHRATVLELFDQFVDFVLFLNAVSVVYDLEGLVWLLLDRAVVRAAVDARPHLFALVYHRFEHLQVLARLRVVFDSPQTAVTFLLRKQQPRAVFADGLQNVERVLEVAHMKDGQRQFHKAKVARTVEEGSLARLANQAALRRAHVDVFRTTCERSRTIVAVQAILIHIDGGSAVHVTGSKQTELD